MNTSGEDIWSKWLTDGRFGGDEDVRRRTMEHLRSVRDEVLRHADLQSGEVLLDVGSGDGLIAFGALEEVAGSTVVFSDISQNLIERTRTMAEEAGLLERCRFVEASAEDLSAIGDASVDVVTTRSVLIYVDDKQRAFHEFHRVLKPGGRVSIFEPINRYFLARRDLFAGVDVTPVLEIVEKVRAEYERVHPPETDPLVNFDERDLLLWVEKARFQELHLELKVTIKPEPPLDWDTALRVRPNPKGLTLEEAMNRALTVDERERLVAHLRPVVESGQRTARKAFAFLRAVRGSA